MSENGTPTLAVVMATRNRLATLRPALKALVSKIRVSHEIIVVDLGSTDGTLDYLKEIENVRCVPGGEPRGQALNLNPVFAALNSRYICWLSDDNVVLDGMLDVAVSILEDDPAVGLVGLKVKDVIGPKQAEPYIGAIWPSGVLNCNQGVIRAAVFRQAGFFDEAFQTYGVDPDLTTQVLLAGYKVVFTRQVAIHHYRDHTAAPGALQLAEREKNRRAAHKTYAHKYRALLQKRPLWQRLLYGGFWRFGVLPLHGAAHWLKVPLEAWLGYHQRDWANLLYARHVSLLDFVLTRGKPYYLVQQIKPSHRPAQAQVAASEAGSQPHLAPAEGRNDSLEYDNVR